MNNPPQQRSCMGCQIVIDAVGGRTRCPECQTAYQRNRKKDRLANDPEYKLLCRRRDSGWDKTVTPQAVQAMITDQSHMCANPYCDAGISEGYDMDHIVAFSRGGPSTLSNLQLLCTWCNRSKRDKPWQEFLEHYVTHQQKAA